MKAGDKVRIRYRRIGQEYEWPNYVDDMLQYAGQIAEIRHVEEDNNTCVLKGISFTWLLDWVEEVNAFVEEELFEI